MGGHNRCHNFHFNKKTLKPSSKHYFKVVAHPIGEVKGQNQLGRVHQIREVKGQK